MAGEYPKRTGHFAHRFVRLLAKSCAAQDIGQNACLLLCYIAHTEDAARYRGPVRFWNEQLMTTMGFKSPKQLLSARSKAEEAGWLVYERSGNRQVGKYWVTIPGQFEGLEDTVIESNHSVNHSENGTNSGMNEERIAERIGEGLRNEKGRESGKPSNPIPKPNPLSLSAAFAAFDVWWKHYPRKLNKGAARDAYVKAIKKMKAATEDEAHAELLAASIPRLKKLSERETQYIPHATTWLNQECWTDELDDISPAASNGKHVPTIATDEELKRWNPYTGIAPE